MHPTGATREQTVVIINYGMGNIGSVANALGWLGARCLVSGDKADMAQGDAFILPGVGAFGAAMDNLRRQDLIGPLEEQIRHRRKPLLGICLGMQLLAETSEEYGLHEGLGWIKGRVTRLSADSGLRLPHVGWNTVEATASDPLFLNIDPGAHFFFDHSFILAGADGAVTGETVYGERFTAAIRQDNILATQFHPEKSQRSGLKLLRNFLNFALAGGR